MYKTRRIQCFLCFMFLFFFLLFVCWGGVQKHAITEQKGMAVHLEGAAVVVMVAASTPAVSQPRLQAFGYFLETL